MNENKSRPYVLAETNWKTVRDTEYQVVVLPWGATEAHNYHLPYATDNIQAEFVAVEAARLAWDSGAKVIVFPCIPFGVNTGQMDIKFCINMNPSTQLQVLKDLATVILNAGVQKLVILNGHGGNHFKQIMRELCLSHPDLFVCSVNWYEAINADDYFDQPGDHAGEMETSCMLKIVPRLVRPLDEAGHGTARSFSITGFKQGWATAPRGWTKVTRDTGVGNPQKSTVEKGASFLDAACKKAAEFLVDLAGTDIDNLYE